MDKIKLLSVVVIVLLILNFGLIGYIMFYKTDGNFRTSQNAESVQPKVIIIKKLNFDSEQIKKYQVLINAHRLQIRATEVKIKNLKNKLYALLKDNNTNQNAKAILIDSLTICQKQIELTHFNHFQAIKTLCKKAQLSDFNNLTEDLSKLFPRRQKPKHEN